MAGRSVLQLLQIALVARFLSPAELGVLALVVGVVAMAQLFSDIGLSTAIIHFQEISGPELSSLYWLNVLSGALLTIFIAALAPLLSRIYHAPEIGGLVALSGCTFFVSALGQQLRVVAIKEMRFAKLAIVELVAALAGFGVILGWLLLKPGTLALVAGMIATSLVTTTLLWIQFANGWRPQWRLRFSELHRFLRFGGFTTANNLVSALNRQSDVFIGGGVMSAAGLGLYSLPRDLTLRLGGVVNSVATQVGLPLMAAAQHDTDYLRRIYLKTVGFTASVNTPIFVFIALFSKEIALLAFGPQRLDAAPILAILATWGLIRSTMNPVGSLTSAVGRPDLEFLWNLALLVILPLAIWAGARNGPAGLAWIQTAAMAGSLLPHWFFLLRPLCGCGLLEFLRQLAVPLACAAVAGAAASALAYGIGAAPLGLPALLGATAVYGAVYAGMSWLINRDWFIAMRELAFKR